MSIAAMITTSTTATYMVRGDWASAGSRTRISDPAATLVASKRLNSRPSTITDGDGESPAPSTRTAGSSSSTSSVATAESSVMRSGKASDGT